MESQYPNIKINSHTLQVKVLVIFLKSILFGLRSHTIQIIRMNFPNMYSENSLCPMCERSVDTQERLLLCTVLQNILPLKNHIEHGTVEQQHEYVKIYSCYLELWDKLMGSDDDSSLPGLYTGPMRPQAAGRGPPRHPSLQDFD